MTQMRKGIAAKMTQVKQTVPHAYTVVEVDMTNVVRWREANNEAYKAREGAGISYVAVVIKAVTEALRAHPTLNSQFAGDRIILKQRLNIGIAVAVDNGLVVPVIADADQLSISGVNRRVQDLAARARANRLKLDEIQGGTFTVNNTGWFGSISSMPIINAPEVAILSMEAIVKRPRVIEVDGADVIAVRHLMNMTCSFDHRVLDGAQVGYFMADVRKRLELGPGHAARVAPGRRRRPPGIGSPLIRRTAGIQAMAPAAWSAMNSRISSPGPPTTAPGTNHTSGPSSSANTSAPMPIAPSDSDKGENPHAGLAHGRGRSGVGRAWCRSTSVLPVVFAGLNGGRSRRGRTVGSDGGVVSRGAGEAASESSGRVRRGQEGGAALGAGVGVGRSAGVTTAGQTPRLDLGAGAILLAVGMGVPGLGSDLGRP